MVFPLLLLLFVLVPIVELALLIRVGQVIGLGLTIGLVLVTGVLGAALARREGLAAARRIREDLAAARPPAESLASTALVLVAGILLITPGMLTDAVGLALLVRPIRHLVAASILRHLHQAGSWHVQTRGTWRPPGPDDPGDPRDPGAGDFGEQVDPRPRRRVDATTTRVKKDRS